MKESTHFPGYYFWFVLSHLIAKLPSRVTLINDISEHHH